MAWRSLCVGCLYIVECIPRARGIWMLSGLASYLISTCGGPINGPDVHYEGRQTPILMVHNHLFGFVR